MSLDVVEGFVNDCCRYSFLLIIKCKLSQDITGEKKEFFERMHKAEKMMEECKLVLDKNSSEDPSEQAEIDRRFEAVKKKYLLFKKVIPYLNSDDVQTEGTESTIKE